MILFNLATFKTSMKKIVAFLLLTAFFLNIIGYHFLFQIQQHSLKVNMKEYLSLKDIQSAIELNFSLSDKSAFSKLEWEDEKEFRMNGELYDVIEKRKENGKLIIVCIKDKKETHLVSNYDKLNKEAQGDLSSKSKSTILLNLIAGIFIQNELPVISIPGFVNKKPSTILDDLISSGMKEILVPPPQVVA